MQGQNYGKRAAAARFARDFQAATVSLNDMSCESKPESRPWYALGVARADPIKLLEYSRLILGGDSDTPIDDLNDGFRVRVIKTQVDIPRVAGVFHSVRKQIEYGLFQRIGVGHDRKDRRALIFDRDGEREPVLSQRILHCFCGGTDDIG